MRNVAMMFGAISCCALSACSPSGGERIDSNLECAALISAANALVISGKAENDPGLAKRALVSSMTYLAAYAIPKGIKEAEAFEQVKSLRATLIESLTPVDIMSRARRCADRSPR
ncbi:MAG: hypothetical protein KJ587_00425 [Alphaproteobacteria bacterium]|nr:hypothetical protein [Alphaproteobacteria bacterium]